MIFLMNQGFPGSMMTEFLVRFSLSQNCFNFNIIGSRKILSNDKGYTSRQHKNLAMMDRLKHSIIFNDPFKLNLAQSSRDALRHQHIKVANFDDRSVSPSNKNHNTISKGSNQWSSALGNSSMKAKWGKIESYVL